jgi:hypothetical protein
MTSGAETAVAANEDVVPASELKAAQAKIRWSGVVAGSSSGPTTSGADEAVRRGGTEGASSTRRATEEKPGCLSEKNGRSR